MRRVAGNKYGARKEIVDNISFDSRAEARRYRQLRLRERLGEITDLRVHPSWKLVVNGELIGRYTADFEYIEGGDDVVEDVKSPATAKKADYRLRKKLMKALFGIDVREVT